MKSIVLESAKGVKGGKVQLTFSQRPALHAETPAEASEHKSLTTKQNARHPQSLPLPRHSHALDNRWSMHL